MVLESDGTVSLYTGSSSVGQGVETVMAQIAADALDMPMARINRVQHGSTTVVKQGYGSYSSRSIVMGGSAIVQAAGFLKDAIRAAAAKRLQCEPGDDRHRRRQRGRAEPRFGRAVRARRRRHLRPKAPIPATSAPTATARTPPMSRSIPAPAMSR